MSETNIIEITNIINKLWEDRSNIIKDEYTRDVIENTINLLDNGNIRVGEKKDGTWVINEWIKKAILLSFRINDNELIAGGPQNSHWFDKIASKFANWNQDDFNKSGFRSVPGSIVRRGSFIGKNVILMPCFLNIGCYVGENTMIDTWSTVGSCAQIGKNCHISGGVGIGGVLEPIQANPVIIEDNCFIGARSEIAEGVIVEEGSVISMGVFIGASTKIYNRVTGEISYGRVPAYSVVVPGTLPSSHPGDLSSLSAAIIVKQVDEKTRSKTSINELLRI